MRRPLVLTVLLMLIAPAWARADDMVQLVAFHGPASPSAGAVAARERVAARARDAGLAWINLSPAAPPASLAAGQLRSGVDAYDELRWDDALHALDAAIDELWRTGGDGLGATQLSDAFLYRGLVTTQRGDAAVAWDDLVRAATLAPARTLDPLRFPTRAVEAFNRARAAVAALPRATLSVEAPGCEAAIDGGAAARAEVAHGEHLVRVACPGRAPWGQRVVVAGDVTVTPPPDPAAAPPDDAALGALAVARGALAVLAVVVSEDGGTAIAALRVVDARGRAGAAASVRLDDADAVAAGGALDDAVDRVLAPPITIAPPPRRRWWRSPWLWAAAGATVTAAVLIPFAIGGDGGGGTATLRPLGWTW